MPSDEHESLTAHPRALDLFTDRFAERRRFARCLHAQPPEPRPIFFHDDGGNGKSLLLKHLRAEFCRLLPADQWAHCDAQPDTRAGDQACLDAYLALVGADDAGDSIKVPCIWHDFAATEAIEGNPQDAWPALLMLRKQLTKDGFKLPTFDYAVTRWLHATDRLSADQLKLLLPVEELDALGATVDYVTSTQSPTLNLLARGLEVVAKNWQGNLQLLLAQRRIDAATRKRLDTLFDTDPDPSALDNALNALPRLFANDLNAWMQRPGVTPRLVLLFDTHEAFWGSDRDQSRSRQCWFDEDAWLRRLVSGLYPVGEPNRGIVVVIAGREPPRWAEAVADKIEAKRIDCQLVGHWGRADARDYLIRALDPANVFTDPADDHRPPNAASASEQPNPAHDEALLEALIRSAEVAADQVHPLYLGLAADTVRLANEQGQRVTFDAFAVAPEHTDHRAAMVERLLKYCPEAVAHAVKALAAARGFDEILFYRLGERLHFRHERPDFETLIRFSFCWTSPERDRYRIHDLLRRLLAEQDPERMQQAHAALEAIYRERTQTEPVAIAEAIYHSNRQDWERGAEEWLDTMDSAILNAHWALAEALAEVRPVLRLESAFHRGLLAAQIAELAARLSRHQAAEAAFLQAIAACDQALARKPQDIDAYNNKGIALTRLGALRAALSNHAGARAAYQDAIAAYDQALARAPMLVEADNNKGNALQGLGALLAALGDREGAQVAYQSAIAAYDQALDREPDLVKAHYSKGNALQRLGDLRVALGDDEGAQAAYHDAIDALDQALAWAPECIDAHHNKGSAFKGLGDLRAALNDDAGAQVAYQDAIAAYDRALAKAPDLIDGLCAKALCLTAMAELAETQGHRENACTRLHEAEALLQRALVISPRHPELLALAEQVQALLAEFGPVETKLET